MRTFYINPSKSQKEQSFYETFLSNMKDLQIENCVRSEAPDYILNISQRRIGLELTTLVLNNSVGRPPLAAIRAAQNCCLRIAAQLAKQHGMEPVEVKVKFRSDQNPIDVELAARELIKFVNEKTCKIDDTKTWHFYESGLKYSQWISIHLGTANGRRWLSNHRFLRIHMNWMRIDPVEEIQARIDEKQPKIKKYIQKCDECWLLIGVDEWTAPESVTITEQLEDHAFSGDFRRLFFLKNIEGKLAELRISPFQKK